MAFDRMFRTGDAIPRIFGFVIISIIAILFFSRFLLITDIVSLDYNEGWNAFHTQNLMEHGNPYPGSGLLTANNYPPLSFLIVGSLSRIVGDLIISGRILSFLSIISVGLSIYSIIRLLAPEWKQGAWLGTTIFFAFNATVFRGYVGMNDPQWLGHALMTGGLLLLLSHRDTGRIPAPILLGSALLMVAGGLVKHNIIVTPAAVTLWLAVNDRKSCFLWLAVGITFVLFTIGLDKYAFNGNMMANVLGFPRQYYLWRMVEHGAVAILLLPLIIISWRIIRIQAADRRLQILTLGCTFSVILSIIQGSGAGVDINAYFEALIFLSITVPVAISRCENLQAGKTLILLALPLVVLLPFGMFGLANEWQNRQVDIAETRKIIDAIAKVPGAVACQTPALCYWAGKQFEMDFFYASQTLPKSPELIHKALQGPLRLAAVEMTLPPNGGKFGPLEGLIAAQYRPYFFQENRPYLSQERRRLYAPR